MKQKPIAANDLVIMALQKTDDLPYDLLLIADPSKHTIDKYISHSVVEKAKLKGVKKIIIGTGNSSVG